MSGQITATNSTKTVFGWFLDQEARLHQRLQLVRVRRALRDAFARFAQGNPLMVNSLFDAHFVETRVAPLVDLAFEQSRPVRPEAITAAWFAAARASEASADRFDLSAITAAAAELLGYLDEELN